MARWHSCNVLESASNTRTLWQFSAGGGKFTLQRQESRLPTEPLPAKAIAKDWQTLFQPKLNVAWLPAQHVFLRVVQLPKADLGETRSMVELQLEKLSPLPVAQIVWGFELLPHPDPEMQTAVVIIIARPHVEEFLGQLEGQGYLADRLELPFLDQLRALDLSGDGAWVFPGIGPDNYSCLIAWWYGGILQNLSLLHLPPSADRARLFEEQLSQMTWAGELEGWLTSPPRYRLVAEGLQAEDWRNLFSLAMPVDIVPPLQSSELAALTARRSATNGLMTNLLPPEYTSRYRQQFIDRIWMRSLAAVLFLYVLGVVVYFAFVGYAQFTLSRKQTELRKIAPDYTNTFKLRERVRVLQDQLDLQFAALDCYKATSDFLPSELTLDSINFGDRGSRVTLTGTVSGNDVRKVYDFNEAMRNAKVKDQPLFSKVNPPSINPRQGDQKSWTFVCELKRTEVE
jgi:hypothetical protein